MRATYLMSDTMASTQFNRTTRASSHGIHRTKLALQMGITISAILLTLQQTRNQATKGIPRKSIRLRRRAHNGTQCLDAVVNGTDAGTQPDRVGRRLCQFRVEDDQSWSAQGSLEAILAP